MYKNIQDGRIVLRMKPFHDPLPKQKLETFSDINKPRIAKSTQQGDCPESRPQVVWPYGSLCNKKEVGLEISAGPRKERSSQDSFLLVKIASSCTVFVQTVTPECGAVLLKSVPVSPTQVVRVVL